MGGWQKLADVTAVALESLTAGDKRKIVTKLDPPPIPIRDCDWSATFEDYDLGDPVGHGGTEAEAIADLMMEAEMDE